MKPTAHKLFGEKLDYFFNDPEYWFDDSWMGPFKDDITTDTRGMEPEEVRATWTFEDNEVYRILLEINGALPSEIYA